MDILRFVAGIANVLLLIYMIVLLARLIMEYIPLFNREWRPRGAGLVLAEIVFTVTDPPIKFFRRLIPPLRIGPVAIDLGFTLTLIACIILLAVVRAIAAL